MILLDAFSCVLETGFTLFSIEHKYNIYFFRILKHDKLHHYTHAHTFLTFLGYKSHLIVHRADMNKVIDKS